MIKKLSIYHIKSIFEYKPSKKVFNIPGAGALIKDDLEKFLSKKTELKVGNTWLWSDDVFDGENNIYEYIIQFSQAEKDDIRGNFYVVWLKENLHCNKVYFSGHDKKGKEVFLEWKND